MTDLLKIGSGGIRAYQTALSTTGNNITSANVDGYSRQDATFATRPSQEKSSYYLGNGVFNDSVRRIADDFLVKQVRVDTSSFNGFNEYLKNISQLDELLADTKTGLMPSVQKVFTALQSSAQDPASIPARQLVLTEVDGLLDRFKSMDKRLEDQYKTVNLQISVIAEEISSISSSIAKVNTALNAAKGNHPNDLLDQRDKLLKDLSVFVNIDTVFNGKGAVDVFVGSGQPLVIGQIDSPLSVKPAAEDTTRTEVGIVSNGEFQLITDRLKGGKLGGLVRFRDDMLAQSRNEVSRLALVIASNLNDQNRLGLDLEGRFGERIFTDVNDPDILNKRVLFNENNALPEDRVISVEIKDAAKLQASEYQLVFNGPTDFNYVLTRKSDNEPVLQGVLPDVKPVSLDIDGLKITLKSGSFQEGDKFLFQPMRNVLDNLERSVQRPQELAYSYPISTGSNTGNLGNGAISQGEMLAVKQADGTVLPSFSNPDQLSPPILVRFTSETTYDVLDNSDPAKPVDLDPPMRGRVFLPNLKNDVFAQSPHQTSSFSDPASASNPTLRTVGNTTGNGFPTENITITMTDPENGLPSNHTVNLAGDESAKSSAYKLGQIPGVRAYADTSVTLQITDPGGSPQNISLNGINLTNPALGDVPTPITADFIRNRINSDPSLKAAGINAISDGTNLTVRATKGDDLDFNLVSGAAGSSLNITQMNGQPAQGTTALNVGDNVKVGGVLYVDMENNGVLKTDAAIPGGRFTNPPPEQFKTFFGYQITLSGTPANGDEFTVKYNKDASADSRNATAMVDLQTKKTVANGTTSYQDAYGQMVETIGSKTNQVRSNNDAAKALLRQSEGTREALSGVNLDEEAAKLIKFEQAYNAAAQVVSIAQQTFDALINAVR